MFNNLFISLFDQLIYGRVKYKQTGSSCGGGNPKQFRTYLGYTVINHLKAFYKAA